MHVLRKLTVVTNLSNALIINVFISSNWTAKWTQTNYSNMKAENSNMLNWWYIWNQFHPSITFVFLKVKAVDSTSLDDTLFYSQAIFVLLSLLDSSFGLLFIFTSYFFWCMFWYEASLPLHKLHHWDSPQKWGQGFPLPIHAKNPLSGIANTLHDATVIPFYLLILPLRGGWRVGSLALRWLMSS